MDTPLQYVVGRISRVRYEVSPDLARVDLTKQPRHLPPCLRMHRQHVDDVGPVVAMSVAVAK
jgi:hypothetical protein